jgi:hypothetical protein
VPISEIRKKPSELNKSSASPNLESQNLHPLTKSFNWQFQEQFPGDIHHEGPEISKKKSKKLLDISSNDE